MEVTESEVTASTSTNQVPIANASQSKIAQKTWEISNFIQGLFISFIFVCL
jgi:hypothetical protein